MGLSRHLIVDLTEPKIGPKRSEWLYPFGALKAAGATIVGLSDWSVSSMNPLEAIQTGVTRQDIGDANGDVLTPQHKLDVMDMLRAYTVNGAFAAFDETRIRHADGRKTRRHRRARPRHNENSSDRDFGRQGAGHADRRRAGL